MSNNNSNSVNWDDYSQCNYCGDIDEGEFVLVRGVPCCDGCLHRAERGAIGAMDQAPLDQIWTEKTGQVRDQVTQEEEKVKFLYF